jgi:hypothetical protein
LLKLKILLQISCSRAPDKIQPCFHMGANLEPLSIKLHDSFRFLYPPLPAWYCASVTRGLPRAGNHTGLSRFTLITRWVRCCLYAEGTISMYEVRQVHILPLYLLVKAYQQLSLLQLTTLTTVHICSPYHPSRHHPNCCYRMVTLSRQLQTRDHSTRMCR